VGILLLPVALLVLAPIAFLFVSIFDAVARPTIRRLAFRNLTRRRGEAALVTLGAMLGTAIITAALIVGNTLGASFKDIARRELGPTDLVVRAIGLNNNQGVYDSLKAQEIPNVDGLLKMSRAGVSVSTTGDDSLAEPFAGLGEVDFDEARAFGGDVGATGMADAGPTPTGDQAVLSESLADEIKADVGDRIVVYGYANRIDLVVRTVLPTKGLAGFGGRNLYAEPGTIAKLISGGNGQPVGAVSGEAPASLVLVSNSGGVFEGATHTDEVRKALDTRLDSVEGVEVITAKQNLLDESDDIAAQFTQLFGGIGSFSVIAGIGLLITIFVMLADERKSELGMLRAIGLKRNQLVRAFGMEGAVYALVSSVVGVIVGIGVGRLVATLAASIFGADGGFGGDFGLKFSLEPQSLIIGFLVGAYISLATVWGTSIRLGRLNVIRAIRDLAEPTARGKVRTRTYVLSIVGILFGLVLLQAGVASDAWFPVLGGVPIAGWSSIPLLRAFLPRRVAVFIGCGIPIVWAIAVFSIFPDALSSTEFGAFVEQGVILVGSATAIVATNDDAASWFVARLGVSRRTLAARLGFAYPLARVFRTSMLLFIFAIVVFTLTFLSVFSNLFSAQAPRYAQESAAGYDVLVDSNYSNPVPSSALATNPDVTDDATIDVSFPEWTTDDITEPTRWSVSGFDEKLLAHGVPKLNERLARFASDRAAWEGVMKDPTLVLLSNFFLQRGGPPASGLEVGDKIRAFDTFSGKDATLTVAGKMDSDFLFSGPFVGKSFLRSFSATVTPSRHYVAVKPGADPELVADRLTADLITFGVDADTFERRISEQLSQQKGFLSLMQGYLGLGLIIGIAGLGVVMVRAVRERRRQIGMLRAMGFPSRVVRQAFLVESAFLAVQGVVMGTVLALVTSYSMLTNSDTFGGQSLKFEIPTTNIVIVSVIAIVASLAASNFPARQASRIKPAVALRIAD
jgi:putative ABC transport system permease protein